MIARKLWGSTVLVPVACGAQLVVFVSVPSVSEYNAGGVRWRRGEDGVCLRRGPRQVCDGFGGCCRDDPGGECES